MRNKPQWILVIVFLLYMPSVFTAEQAIESKEIRKAAYHQQRSLSLLVASLKDLRKVLIKGEAQVKQEQNPFDKEKHFKKDGQNLEKSIRNTMKKQKSVSESLQKSGQKGNQQNEDLTQKKQKEVSDALEKIIQNHSLSNNVREAITRAQKSSIQAQKAMEAHESQYARQNTSKSLSAMEQSLEHLGRERRQNMDKYLRQARQQINNAVRQEMGIDEGAQGATQTAKRISNELQLHAADEKHNGLQQLANQLQNLSGVTSKKAKDVQEGRTPQERVSALEQIGVLLDDQRLSSDNLMNQLTKNVNKLKNLEGELQFLGNRPDTQITDDFKNLPLESELTMQDLIHQLKNMDEEYQFKNGNRGIEGKNPSGVYYVNTPSQILPQKGNEYYEQLLGDMSKLLSDAEKIKRKAPAPPSVMQFTPDEVPREYRSDVADYFKNLSENTQNAK